MSDTYYTLTELAKRLGGSSTAAFKRLEKVSVVPIHTREVNGRTYRLYGPDASAKVDQWIASRDALAALRKARTEAAKQRKVARTLRKANAGATAPTHAAGGVERSIDLLTEKLQMMAVAIDVMSRRVDSLVPRHVAPPAGFPLTWPPEVACNTGAPSKVDFTAALGALAEALDEPTLGVR